MESCYDEKMAARDPSWQGKTPYWRGSGYYVPSERGWEMYHDYRDMAHGDRRKAILFEKESFFRAVIQGLAQLGSGQGAALRNPASSRLSTPHEKLILQKPNGWNHEWNGAGLYMEERDTWINDQSGPNVPPAALLFINEEDWIKYKYTHANPSLPEK